MWPQLAARAALLVVPVAHAQTGTTLNSTPSLDNTIARVTLTAGATPKPVVLTTHAALAAAGQDPEAIQNLQVGCTSCKSEVRRA